MSLHISLHDMTHYVRSFILLTLTLILSVTAMAAEATTQSETDTATLDELVKTLESETAREDLLDKLRVLIEAQETEEGSGETDTPTSLVSETLGVERQVDEIARNYQEFLEKNDLNASVIGKAGLTFLALFTALLVGLCVRYASFYLRARLQSLQRRYQFYHNRFRLYTRLIRYAGYVITGLFLVYSIGLIWGITNIGLLQNDIALILIETLLSVTLIAIIVVAIWESVSASVEVAMRRANKRNSNRLKTLLPIIQNVIFILFAALFMLILLSEIGINILPLLAGAGIVGIAIGFGAQTMVKDFITGFTIIFEDLIQVGDVAKLGDRIGLIEKITLRKVQLRDLSGIVYTVPFSEISIVENWTKEYSYYLLDVGVAYRENCDEVIGYLKEIDEEMRSEEPYDNLILEPIEILGVDQFADSAVIIKARIKTLPIKQWEVGREFNRRMKHKFDEMGVEIPYPHQTVYFGQDKAGKAPPAPIELKGAEMIEKKAA